MRRLDAWLARLVRERSGHGLRGSLLLALWLAVPLVFGVRAELAGWMVDLPALQEQLPELAIRGGKLVVEPPLEEPLTLVDRDGRPLLLLDPEARLQLMESEARLQLTRTRVLFKTVDGSVAARSLSEWPDLTLEPGTLDATVRGAVRGALLLVVLPALWLSLVPIVVGLQFVLVLLLALPLRLHGLRLETSARWRLCAAAQTLPLAASGLILWSGASPSWLPWFQFAVCLALLLLFMRRLDAAGAAPQGTDDV